MSHPFASAYDDYHRAGWRGILPLPYGKKTWPPEGYTGYAGDTPSYADLATWADSPPRNICLRLPDGCVGIDVDHYDGKAGGDTLAGLVAKYGALPATFLSTSRADGISGIRVYRVPPGTTMPTKLPGIEFIQRHHRYVVAWPSVHPSGNVYRWIDERTGQTLDGPPRLADLPELPAAWISGLAVEAKAHDKADLDADQALATLAGMPDGDPCPHILAHAGKAVAGADRHDSYNEAVLAVVGAGRRGCPGARPVIARLRSAFIAEVTVPGQSGRRTQPEAEAEWRRGILGAIAIVASDEQGSVCPDDLLQWVDDATAADTSSREQVEPSPFDLAVARKAAELRIHEAAREKLAERHLSLVPPLDGVDLGTFLAQPDEEESYRIEGMWPTQGRILMPAAAKSGKTTLILNLLRALVDGGQFLGHFDATPVTRRVVYLNLEVSEGRMRRWLRRAGIVNVDRIEVVNLRGKVSALQLDTAAGRARFAGWLRALDAEVAVLDPLAPALAAFGLDENSNADVARFFNWWSEALADAGVVEDLIAHHAGHEGKRSRGASRLLDEPDAIWTITKQSVEDDGYEEVYGANEARFLRAIGRDVDIPATALGYDDDTKTVTFRDGITPKLVTDEGLRERIRAWVREHPGRSKSAIRQGVGGNGSKTWDTTTAMIDEGELIEDGRKVYLDA